MRSTSSLVDEVTANQIADQLGVSGRTFRAWLRGERAAGHPILASHAHGAHYRFTRAEADQLTAEHNASAGRARAPGQPHQPESRVAPATTSALPSRSPAVAATTERKPNAEAVAPSASPLPALPASFTRAGLEAAGFTGWMSWHTLRASKFAGVPPRPGVYVVLRPSTHEPSFVHPSPAGHFKGQNPSVPGDRLRSEWVPGAETVYIGKADFRKRRKKIEALRERLGEYGAFGAGEPAAHAGGRLIWQLADANLLLVAWHEVTWAETARQYEKRLLAQFAHLHDHRRPFANLTG